MAYHGRASRIHISEAFLVDIQEMRSYGVPIAVIARAYDITPQTIRKYLNLSDYVDDSLENKLSAFEILEDAGFTREKLKYILNISQKNIQDYYGEKGQQYKRYEAVDEFGNKHTFNSTEEVRAFCKSKHLLWFGVLKVIKGFRKSYYGWKFKYMEAA